MLLAGFDWSSDFQNGGFALSFHCSSKASKGKEIPF
jgi:hypothetical protein